RGGGIVSGPAADAARVAIGDLRGEADLEKASRSAEEAPLVLDLSGRAWLNSLELGAVARLARAAATGGRRLLLAGVSRRALRLLQLLRLDRWVDGARPADEWARRLEEGGSGVEGGRTRWGGEGREGRGGAGGGVLA